MGYARLSGRRGSLGCAGTDEIKVWQVGAILKINAIYKDLCTDQEKNNYEIVGFNYVIIAAVASQIRSVF